MVPVHYNFRPVADVLENNGLLPPAAVKEDLDAYIARIRRGVDDLHILEDSENGYVFNHHSSSYEVNPTTQTLECWRPDGTNYQFTYSFSEKHFTHVGQRFLSAPHLNKPYDQHPVLQNLINKEDVGTHLSKVYPNVRSILLTGIRHTIGHHVNKGLKRKADDDDAKEHHNVIMAYVKLFRYMTDYNKSHHEHLVNPESGDYFCYEVRNKHELHMVYAYNGVTKIGVEIPPEAYCSHLLLTFVPDLNNVEQLTHDSIRELDSYPNIDYTSKSASSVYAEEEAVFLVIYNKLSIDYRHYLKRISTTVPFYSSIDENSIQKTISERMGNALIWCLQNLERIQIGSEAATAMVDLVFLYLGDASLLEDQLSRYNQENKILENRATMAKAMCAILELKGEGAFLENEKQLRKGDFSTSTIGNVKHWLRIKFKHYLAKNEIKLAGNSWAKRGNHDWNLADTEIEKSLTKRSNMINNVKTRLKKKMQSLAVPDKLDDHVCATVAYNINVYLYLQRFYNQCRLLINHEIDEKVKAACFQSLRQTNPPELENSNATQLQVLGIHLGNGVCGWFDQSKLGKFETLIRIRSDYMSLSSNNKPQGQVAAMKSFKATDISCIPTALDELRNKLFDIPLQIGPVVHNHDPHVQN